MKRRDFLKGITGALLAAGTGLSLAEAEPAPCPSTWDRINNLKITYKKSFHRGWHQDLHVWSVDQGNIVWEYAVLMDPNTEDYSAEYDFYTKEAYKSFHRRLTNQA